MNLDISQTSHTTVNPQEAHPVRTSPPAPPKVRPTTSSAWHRIWPWVRLLSGPLAAVLAILVLRSGAIPLYTEFTIGLGAVYALMVLSLSLLASWTGIWSIGHPALVAIGAYAMAYGSGHGWSLQLTIALTVTACALIGAFLGFVGSRFSVLYVALLTLAFTLVCLEIINVWQGVTNGDQGVPVNIVSTPLGDIFPSSSEAIYIVIGTLGLCLAGAEAVRRSSIRLRLVAAKTHPVVARTIGISPEAQSAIGFAVSGASGRTGRSHARPGLRLRQPRDLLPGSRGQPDRGKRARRHRQPDRCGARRRLPGVCAERGVVPLDRPALPARWTAHPVPDLPARGRGPCDRRAGGPLDGLDRADGAEQGDGVRGRQACADAGSRRTPTRAHS